MTVQGPYAVCPIFTSCSEEVVHFGKLLAIMFASWLVAVLPNLQAFTLTAQFDCLSKLLAQLLLASSGFSQPGCRCLTLDLLYRNGIAQKPVYETALWSRPQPGSKHGCVKPYCS